MLVQKVQQKIALKKIDREKRYWKNFAQETPVQPNPHRARKPRPERAPTTT
jgi:hypothetical protein